MGILRDMGEKGHFGGYGPFLTSVLEDVVENEFNSSPNNYLCL